MALIKGTNNGERLFGDTDPSHLDDTIFGLGGDDSLFGGAGDDILNGGGGYDYAFYNNAPGAVSANLSTGIAVQNGGRDTLISIEGLVGGAADDRLTGDDANNTLYGLAGDDILSGGGGGDALRGADGRDTLAGGDGNDVLYGGASGDKLVGGGGTDTATFDADPAAVAASLLTGGSGGAAFGDTYASIENLTGSAYNDSLQGDNSANVLVGNAGDDTLDGLQGDDVMSGGVGADTLIGGAGVDRMTGGAGADHFVFQRLSDSLPASPDVITDLSNDDVIDLRALDADSRQPGDQAFVIVNKFTHHAGEVTVHYNPASKSTMIALDVNGDGDPDVTVRVLGDHHDFTNFLL